MNSLTKPVSRNGDTWIFDGRIEATGSLGMIDGVLSDELVFQYRYTPQDVYSLMEAWARGKITQEEYVRELDKLTGLPFVEKRIYYVPEFNWN